MTATEQRQVSHDAVKNLFEEKPDIIPVQYQESIIKHLVDGVSKTKAAESVGISRPSWQRHLEKVQRALETFHVEGERLDPRRQRIEYIHPTRIDVTTFQPRNIDDPSEAFIEDIRRHGGNHQAITVREKPRRYGSKDYDCIKGHRRLKALLAINAGLSPAEHLLAKCIVEPLDDKQAALESLTDNMFHKDLETTDRDLWIAKLVLDYGWTPSQLDERFEDLSADAISNIVRSYRDATATVRALLDSRDIAVGHVKAIVSLPPEDQDRIADRILKRIKDSVTDGTFPFGGPSVREVESWARMARNRNEAVKRLESYFTELVNKGETILHVRNSDEIVQQVFGGFRYNDYRVRDYDVANAAKAAGITLEYPPLEDSLNELRDKYSLQEEEGGKSGSDGKRLIDNESWMEKKDEAVIEESPPKDLCNNCAAFSHAEQICALGLLEVGLKPEEVFECPGFLHSDDRRPFVSQCPICKHQTMVIHGETPYLNETPSAISLTHDSPHAEFRMHTQCVAQHLIRKKLLSGMCESCSGAFCPFIHSDNMVSIVGQIRMDIKECGYLSKKQKLSEINKWADGEYRAAQVRKRRSRPGGRTPEKRGWAAKQ